MKTKKIEQRLTMMETNYTHIEKTLEQLVSKLDSHEQRVGDKFDSMGKLIYIGFGILVAMQLFISSGVIKLGGA